MNTNLLDRIDSELEFYYKNPKTFIPGYVNPFNLKDWDNAFDKINVLIKNGENFTIQTYTEILTSDEYLQKVIDMINQSELDIKISFSTSTQFEKSYHPLTNLNIHWLRQPIRESISWERLQPYVRLFDKSNFKTFNKSIKGILSVRKDLGWRTHLFEKLNEKDFDGIYRYAKWIRNANDETLELINKKTEFPTYLQLIDEYRKSYISFVVESDSENGTLNYLTEKTIIALLTKTLPIVLGGKDYIKELETMGFYIFNEMFDFSEDSNDNIYHRVDDYIKCIDKFNSMDLVDVKNIYLENIDKINHNYNLAATYVWKRYNKI